MEDLGTVLDPPPADPLRTYTSDLVAKARAGKLDPVISREAEMRRALQILGRRTKNNPVLVGQPGTGKTAIVEGLAMRIAASDVPESMKKWRLLALDLPQMLAGTRYRGDFEQRLKSVIAAVLAAPNVVLFIDEIHTIVGAGSREGALDAGDMLKPVLARGEFRCIGATTTTEYEQYLMKDKALARRFQPVWVKEPSIEDAIVMIRGIKDRYEAHHRVRISDGAVCAAVELAAKHIADRYLPDKAIDLIDEAASQLRLASESVPDELAAAEQACVRSEIELHAIQFESGEAAQHRREWLGGEIAHRRAETNALRMRWNEEKRLVGELNDLVRHEEALRNEEEQARRSGQLGRVADIAYKALPENSRRIEALQAELKGARAGGMLLRDVVHERDIAEVAAQWTGKSIEELSH